MANALLSQAAVSTPASSKRGILERLFTVWFQGFVYNQIWEDPEVDLAAMQLTPDCRILTIASGGCNILNYLTENPAAIDAVDLNPAHLALTRLKITGLTALPDYDTFFRFFGVAAEKANTRAYDDFIAPELDPESRAFWQKRITLRGRRINYFARNLYRFGLMGRFIGILHLFMRLHGHRAKEILACETPEEQRRVFEEMIGPMFDRRFVKALCSMPTSFYGLGIPPAQFEALKEASGGSMARLFRNRLERLACDFPIQENYFAWQAFARRYDTETRRALPRYLRPENYQLLRDRIDRVATHRIIMTDYLKAQGDQSCDRYVLLDAQDWMNDAQLTELWAEITRTSKPGARVIFRTAGEVSPLEKALPNEIRQRWDYDPEEGRALHARDMSSVYGGFHLYKLAAAT